MSETPPPPLFYQYGYTQPPPMVNVAQQQAYATRSTHGSAGPVIGVLAVITILGAAAVVIGRLCSGRGIFGKGTRYDSESWVETKCSSCVDGRVVDSPPPTRRRVVVEQQTHVNRTVEPTAATAPGEESDGDDEAEDSNSDEQEQPEQRRNHEPPVHPPPLDRSQGP